MHSLLDFLTAAPKSYVIKLHRRQDPNVGLMQAAKVIQLVYEWAIDTARLESTLKQADIQGRHLLSLIYVSENRGVTEAELLGSLDGFPPSQVLMLLGKLELELLIYSRDGDKSHTYHGFEEMAQIVLPIILNEKWITQPQPQIGNPSGSTTSVESTNWISYKHFLSSHLCHFLCQIALGGIKITQNGEMHRKDQQEIAARFSWGEKLSSSVPGEEVQLLLHFAVAENLVSQEDGVLFLSTDGKNILHGSRKVAWKQFVKWWMTSRVHGMAEMLKAIASLIQTDANGLFSGPQNQPTLASRIAPWANLLWIFSGSQRKGFQDEKNSFTWENLPKVMQELWMLGFVDFGMTKGKIGWIRPSPDVLENFTSEFDTETKVTSPISLPNLESLVPLDSPLRWQYRLELVSHKSNDEFMGRFHFTKESVIQGLQSGLPMEEFTELLTWLGFEAHAKRTLQDWAATYASTLFMDALILKVSDTMRFCELQEIPQFMELIREVIPHYGFILTRQNKVQVKELLQHFGLVPGEDTRRILALEKVVLASNGVNWAFVVPDPGVFGYRETPGSMRAQVALPQDKLSVASREQELAQKIHMLEDAIAQEKQIEFSYPAPLPKRIILRPLLLLKHRDPMKIIGVELESGHRNEYVLENVKAIRIMD